MNGSSYLKGISGVQLRATGVVHIASPVFKAAYEVRDHIICNISKPIKTLIDNDMDTPSKGDITRVLQDIECGKNKRRTIEVGTSAYADSLATQFSKFSWWIMPNTQELSIYPSDTANYFKYLLWFVSACILQFAPDDFKFKRLIWPFLWDEDSGNIKSRCETQVISKDGSKVANSANEDILGNVKIADENSDMSDIYTEQCETAAEIAASQLILRFMWVISCQRHYCICQ